MGIVVFQAVAEWMDRNGLAAAWRTWRAARPTDMSP